MEAWLQDTAHAVAPLLVVGALASATTSTEAHASDPIGDCYTAAEASHNGRQLTVSWGAQSSVTTSDIDTFMQLVAERHDDPNFAVVANAAGEAAVEQAMECVLDTDRTTLSSVILNQAEAATQIRADMLIVTDSGQTLSSMAFASLTTDCLAAPALLFTGGGDSMRLSAQGYGLHDLVVAFGADVEPCFDFSCKGGGGQCLQECLPDGSEECDCHGALGSCGYGVTRKPKQSSIALIELS